MYIYIYDSSTCNAYVIDSCLTTLWITYGIAYHNYK